MKHGDGVIFYITNNGTLQCVEGMRVAHARTVGGGQAGRRWVGVRVRAWAPCPMIHTSVQKHRWVRSIHREQSAS